MWRCIAKEDAVMHQALVNLNNDALNQVSRQPAHMNICELLKKSTSKKTQTLGGKQ